MAAYETPAVAPFGAIAVLRVTTFFENLLGALRAWRIRRRTVRELGALSPRQLADIGLEGLTLDEIASGLRR